ncbi:MAG TPA: hypothetical protein VFO83_15460 [Aggregicoccus sp.]|nr:hypothetical protein [Aggregicoccus sp.]
MPLLLLTLLLGATPAASRAAACEALLEARPDARALAQGAERCREEEPVLAFALTQRALALAPHAPSLQLAHARSLLALEQRGAAAQLLDGLLRTPRPGRAVHAQARLLRAELAQAEGEPARVVALLTPPGDSPRARALLAQARAQLEARAREALAADALAQPPAEGEASAEEEEDARVRPGQEAWGTRGVVQGGGQRTFRLRHVRAGRTYVLLATGHCTLSRPDAKRRRTSPAPRELFGVDFRAQVGSLEAWPLRMGLEPERSAFTFRAPENDPQLFVEDRSSARPGVRCSVRDLSVRVP